jgi:polyhydroxyalkanoate synthase subunit PhaC
VDLLVDTMGNVPGELMNWTFLSLKPFRLTGQKYLDLVNLLDDEPAVQQVQRQDEQQRGRQPHRVAVDPGPQPLEG